jgi:hypothetical protein
LPDVGESLDYDATLRVLRRTLGKVAGNARAFGMRARGRPELISSRTWAELAEIELLLVAQLQTAIRQELRAQPLTPLVQLSALWRAFRDGLMGGEARLVRRQLHAASSHPVASWRRGAPQLEPSLWPFLEARTHYLANTFALALDEPAPFPPLIWHPGSRSFRG